LKAAPAPSTTAGGDPTPDNSGLTPLHSQFDLNRASARSLQQIPGMDAATAQAVLAARPYADKRDLLRRNVLTDAQHERWKVYFVVRRPTSAGHR